MEAGTMSRGAVIGFSVGLLMGIASPAWAADDAVEVEAAQVGATQETDQQVRQAIDAARQEDPALAEEMGRQLGLMESGDLTLHFPQSESTAEGSEATSTGAPALVGPPAGDDQRYSDVQSDPRMQDLHQRFESGELSEDQAREQMFEILKDHGIEPANGREWEHEGGLERGELEHLSPEAREQMEMERFFEHDGERPEMSHEMLERSLELREHQSGAPGLEAPAHEMDAPAREMTGPGGAPHEQGDDEAVPQP